MVESGRAACGEAAKRWGSSTWLLRLRLVQVSLVSDGERRE
jgi:hypothetical protein